MWICYPKAGQLGTELNRDLLHGLAAEQGWDAVRQIALDEVWSALAFKRLATKWRPERAPCPK